MNWRKSLFFILLSILLLLFTSCGGTTPAEEEAPAAPPDTEEQAEEPDVEEEAAPPPEAEEREEATFPRAVDFEGLQYDFEIVVEGEGVMASGRTWITENKRKDVLSWEGMEVTTIADFEANIHYQMNPFMGNTVFVSPLTYEYEEEEMMLAPHEFTGEEWAATSTFIGHERLGDVNCEVWVTEDEGYEITMWIHPELNMPIRLESRGADGEFTYFEYTNIEIGRIPDAEFELPEGMEIVDTHGLLDS